MSQSSMELLVKQMTWESDNVMSLLLVDPDGGLLPEWAPGSHIDLTLRGSLVRQYSLCGDPADRSGYRVAVLREQAALGGSEYIHEALRPGHRLPVGLPRNTFELLPAKRYVFIAGGIGITPILAMIKGAEAGGIPWELHYGGRRRAAMAFLDELSCYGERVHLIPEDEAGLIDLPRVLPRFDEDTLVYACGPEGLLGALEAHTAGWPGETLRLERFKAKQAEVPGEGDRPIEIVLQRTGRTLHVAADQSVLDALVLAGVTVSTSCQAGICGSCETKVLDGVPDHRDSLLSAAERASGNCMMVCVSRAISDRLVLDL